MQITTARVRCILDAPTPAIAARWMWYHGFDPVGRKGTHKGAAMLWDQAQVKQVRAERIAWGLYNPNVDGRVEAVILGLGPRIDPEAIEMGSMETWNPNVFATNEDHQRREERTHRRAKLRGQIDSTTSATDLDYLWTRAGGRRPDRSYGATQHMLAAARSKV